METRRLTHPVSRVGQAVQEEAGSTILIHY